MEIRRLVSGSRFWARESIFKDPTTKNCRDGTSVKDILALYHFDEALRKLTLRYLLHIERHIRSAYSYAFCKAFGDAQTADTAPQNWKKAAAYKKS